MKTCPGYYWAIMVPGDKQPELFFANEQWARAAVAAQFADEPEAAAMVRIFRVRVSYTEAPEGGQ